DEWPETKCFVLDYGGRSEGGGGAARPPSSFLTFLLPFQGS
ncbi:hypothetical protein A2U01_0096244, partial [Trifolium medium]|nr:hypothetical protein [Trifolium medium]